MPSTTAFLRAYYRDPGPAVHAEETGFQRGEAALEATLYRARGERRPLPGWVVLHGLTYLGRQHPSLVRFARAVAASGTTVLVPEIPEWRALRVAPAITVDTIRAAVLALDASPHTLPGRVGVIGFSFGATQALIASVDAALHGHLSGVVAWGGYADVARLFRFGLTGEHDFDGVTHRTQPDPYGRWIMGANYLTAVPGYEGAGAVAAALERLAEEAGRLRTYAWDPLYDPLKTRLRAALSADDRAVFDLFAPLSDGTVEDMATAHRLADELAAAAVAADPLLDPLPQLSRVRVPVLLAHGRDDRLVPFTETLRLQRRLPAAPEPMITALFAHSGGTEHGLGLTGLAREGLRFVRILRRMLNLA
jgi:dienelactone hydrolase